MASAKDELAALKLRATKGQGAARVTLIDHTAKTSKTGTVTDAIAVLAQLVEKGQGQHSIHVVDHEAEKERKLTNPKNTTRRIFNCRTPEQWTALNKVLEPFYEEAVDPHIAIDLVIKALGAFSRETIRGWVQQETAGNPDNEPAPNLPDFLMD